MTQLTRTQALAEAAVIRDQTVKHGNTPAIVGGFLTDLINSTVFIGEAQTPPTAGDGLTGTNVFSVLANGTTLNVSASGVKITDQAANSVLGRAPGSSGAVAAITAGVDGDVLRLSGATLGFGSIATAGLADAAVTMAKLANLAGLSLIGRSASSAGVPAALTASVAGQVPIYNGSTLAFGSPDFGALNATTTGYFGGLDNSAIGGTGGAATVRAGDATGASGTRTGGSVIIRVGTGATAPGTLTIRGGNGAAGVSLTGRNAANSADVSLLNWDSTGSPQMLLASTTAIAVTVKTSAAGAFTLSPGSGQSFSCSATLCELSSPTTLQFALAVISPVFKQQADLNDGVTGDLLTISSQDVTGIGGTGGAMLIHAGDALGGSGTRNGGSLTIRPGSGASANGSLDLQNGAGTSRLKINSTGLGLFGATPAAQQTVSGSRGSGAALADLLTKGATMGYWVDGSSA